MYTCACFVPGTICCPYLSLTYVCCFKLICKFSFCTEFSIQELETVTSVSFIHSWLCIKNSRCWSKLPGQTEKSCEVWKGKLMRTRHQGREPQHSRSSLVVPSLPQPWALDQTKELPIWSRPYSQEGVRVMLWHQWALDQHVSVQCWGRSLRSFLPQQPL